MQLIRGLYSIKASHRGCVATLGNFDGVHPGHRQILNRLLEQARALRLPATVITTEPLPRSGRATLYVQKNARNENKFLPQ